MILKEPAASGQNVYNEYMYINDAWELIGDTAVDLTGYATEAYVTNAIANKADKATTLAGYGITDGATKTALDALSDSVSALKETVNGLVSSQITY